MTLEEKRQYIERNAGRGFAGLRDYYFVLCDEANATEFPCSCPQYDAARIVRECADLAFGDLAGTRIGMAADLRLTDKTDGFLGFSSVQSIFPAALRLAKGEGE